MPGAGPPPPATPPGDRAHTTGCAYEQPGKVFDRTIGMDEIPDGYRAMMDREALKVLIAP